MRLLMCISIGLLAPAFVVHAAETLYLREILACEPSTIDVRLSSEAGRYERRTFKIDGAILRNVVFTDERSGNTFDLVVDPTFGDTVLLAPSAGSNAWLEQFRALFLDFELYEALCESSAINDYRKTHAFPFKLSEPGPAASFAWMQPVIVTTFGR